MKSKTTGILTLIFIFLFMTTFLNAGFYNQEKVRDKVIKVTDLDPTNQPAGEFQSDIITSNMDGGGIFGFAFGIVLLGVILVVALVYIIFNSDWFNG